MQISVKDGQSLYDIALQYYGDIAGFWWLLEDNRLTVESEIQSGDQLTVRDAFLANSALYFRDTEREINNSDEISSVDMPLSVTIASIQNELLGGDGLIRIAVTGGKAPYAYLWSNGAITKNISRLSAGSYTLTVEDARGTQVTLTVYVAVTDTSDYLTDHNRRFILTRGGNKIQLKLEKQKVS